MAGTALTWKRTEAGHYLSTPRDALDGNAYAIDRGQVVHLPGEVWTLTFRGSLVGRFSMLREAKSAAERHAETVETVETVETPYSAAREDARHERDHGVAVPAAEARQRADVRRAAGRDSAGYWDEYAAEVESWENVAEPVETPSLVACSHGRDPETCSGDPRPGFHDIPSRGDHSSFKAQQARRDVDTTRTLPPLPTSQRIPRPTSTVRRLAAARETGQRPPRLCATTLTHQPFAGLSAAMTAAENAATWKARS